MLISPSIASADVLRVADELDYIDKYFDNVHIDIEDGVAIGFPDIIELEKQKGRKVAAFPVSENDWMDMGHLSELEKMRTKLYGD